MRLHSSWRARCSGWAFALEIRVASGIQTLAWEASKQSAKEEILNFGIYNGKKLGSVPESYLLWMVQTLRHGKWASWAGLAQKVLEVNLNRDADSRHFAELQFRSLKEAVDCLAQWNGVVDITTYADLLQKCGNSGALSEGERVHCHIMGSGRGHNTFLGNLLVQMYGNCGDLGRAFAAFEEIRSPNVFSCNMMIAAYAQNGHLQDARRLFDQMPFKDVVSWTCMLAAYAQEAHVQEARSLFQDMPDRDVVAWNAMTAAYAQNGYLEEAEKMFDEMPLRNVASWNAMIQAYAQNGHLEEARVMLDKIPQQDIISCNAMIAGYARNGHLETARSMVEDMPQQDIISWTHMIEGYAQSGQLQDARSMFEMMPKRDLVSWTTLMQAYARTGHLQEAGHMFEKMPQLMLASCHAMIQAYAQNEYLEDAERTFHKILNQNVVSWSIMITAYGVNGELDEARRMFEMMPERNIVSWNAVVKAYCQHGDLENAVSMFYRMPQQDVISWTTMITLYGENEQLDNGKSIFCRMLERNASSWNAMVAAYAQNGDVETAGDLFLRMPQWNGASVNTMIAALAQNGHMQDARSMFDELPQRDVVTWTAMMAAYTQNGHNQEAIELFRMMDLEGVRPDSFTYVRIADACANLAAITEGKIIHASITDSNLQSDVVLMTSLVDMYGKCRLLEDAREIFEQMPRKDQVAWTAIIAAYAQNGHGKDALKLFERMHLEGVKPGKVTHVKVLDACTDGAALENVKKLHANIMENGLQTDGAVGSGLISMLGKCGNLEDARRIFDNISVRDVVSWTAMVAAYAQNGHSQEALKVFQLMELEGMKPDKVSFVSIISACSHGGLLEDGVHYFVALSEDYGIEPAMVHYMCMIDLLGRAGRLEQAENLINSMPVEPDAVAWMSLLSACRSHGDVQRGLRAVQRVSELEPENVAPYVLMSNLRHGTATQPTT